MEDVWGLDIHNHEKLVERRRTSGKKGGAAFAKSCKESAGKSKTDSFIRKGEVVPRLKDIRGW